MPCGGCSKRRSVPRGNPRDVMGGYKYLTDRQIKARLELFKKRYCQSCEKRYQCDLQMYTDCKKK